MQRVPEPRSRWFHGGSKSLSNTLNIKTSFVRHFLPYFFLGATRITAAIRVKLVFSWLHIFSGLTKYVYATRIFKHATQTCKRSSVSAIFCKCTWVFRFMARQEDVNENMVRSVAWKPSAHNEGFEGVWDGVPAIHPLDDGPQCRNTRRQEETKSTDPSIRL